MRASSRHAAPAIVAVAIAAVTVVAVVLLRLGGEPRQEVPELSSFDGVYTATTERLEEVACGGVEEVARCVRATFRLVEGPDRGQAVPVELQADGGRARALEVGGRALLGHQPAVEGFEYVYLDPDRRGPLLLLAVLFAGA